MKLGLSSISFFFFFLFTLNRLIVRLYLSFLPELNNYLLIIQFFSLNHFSNVLNIVINIWM